MKHPSSRYKIRLHPSQPHSIFEDDLSVTQAILDYYNRPFTARSIRAFVHTHPFGSFITEIADCLCQHGVQTTLVSGHPDLFTSKFWTTDPLSTVSDQPRTTSLSEVTRVTKKGVYLLHRVPSAKLIDSELSKKQPVVINCDLRLLQPETETDLSYAIIVDSDEESFSVTDTLLGNTIKKYPKQAVMYAITENMSRHPTAGSILLTKEKL